MILDRTKPRVHKLICDYTVNSYYKNYSKGRPNKLNRKEYGNVVNCLFGRIRDKITTDSYDYKMPRRIGLLKIRKFIKNISIDENGKIVHNMAPN